MVTQSLLLFLEIKETEFPFCYEILHSSYFAMKYSIHPSDPMLIFDYCGKPGKVGICWGCIYSGELEVANYHSASFFDSKNEIEIFVENSSGEVVAARIRPGEPDSLEVVREDFNLFAFASGEIPEYSNCDISRSAEDQFWNEENHRFMNVIWAIQFLSLRTDELKDYLKIAPEQKECIRADPQLKISDGCPYEALLNHATQALISGSNWNEWIHSTILVDSEIENNFSTLCEKIDELEISVDTNSKFLEFIGNPPSSFSLWHEESCKMANLVKEKLGWQGKPVIFSTEECLQEYTWDY